MGVSYVTISLFSTVLSYGGLHCWTTLSPEKLILDSLSSQSSVHSENVVQALESVLDSYTSIALVANFTINIFILVVLSLKVINLLLWNLLITDISCSNNVLSIQKLFKWVSYIFWWNSSHAHVVCLITNLLFWVVSYCRQYINYIEVKCTLSECTTMV